MRATCEKIADRKAFLEEWRQLYARSDARVFLSPAWIGTLLDSAPQREFVCIKVFDDLRGLYGLAMISAAANRPFPLMRDVRLHESGDDALDRIYIEYNDILIAEGAPDGVREAALAAIFDTVPDADQFLFRNATPKLAAATEAVCADHDLSFGTLSSQPTFAIDLKSTAGESVIDGFSSALRAKIRRSIRRYEERGAVKIQRLSTGAEKAIAWTELMRLHRQTWLRRGQQGAFDNRAFSAFHERILEFDPGVADFARLTVGGETIGMLYNLVERGRVYNYQSGFKYEADNQLAPGFVCHALAADRYRADGYALYDMMGGDAEYKRRLGHEGETLSTLAVTRTTLRTRLRAAFKGIRRVPDAKMRQT